MNEVEKENRAIDRVMEELFSEALNWFFLEHDLIHPDVVVECPTQSET